ncbi:hypothetical protein BN137_544 [Cronobacter condimenti 1330]|uniref:DUF7480 domain-containing protein n=1 Tax=Cronobacter condimenti 1330 TaxID=1073999 RepID=K8AAA0_9ENTR|nr:putative T6SS immunity periplasmic lipoprotein [Cronobacter condimenti]ALB62681.1 hypothetical protein AFK62_09280 [Cronobacter condimenti 1330]CCJ71207.1 hypothetical protein BN137_544 [Cronobacter condimenti 1330]
MQSVVVLCLALLAGCAPGEHLDKRYTHETPVAVDRQGQNFCLRLPLQTGEQIVFAMVYNVNVPQQQVMLPKTKQALSGAFCVTPAEFRFMPGENYLMVIEANSASDNKKSTRRAFRAAIHP